jgi:hypothetical protein
MSRTLGSFNRRVNLPSHPQDSAPAHPTRIAALHTEAMPVDRGGTTGAAKFAAGRGRSGRGAENRRFAGDIMNIDISTGIAPTPYDNIASLSYGQEGTVGQMYSRPIGEYYQKANSDLSQRTLVQTETGQDIKISNGMQSAFAPPLAGAAESRSTFTRVALPDMYYYQQ